MHSSGLSLTKSRQSLFLSLKMQPLVASIDSLMQLPPEAFTKETLQEAFQWLQNQPESVRELVHTPESLISIYRKAQRQDNDAPVSSKNFMAELKTLAKGLEAFSDEKPQKQPQFAPPQAPKSPAPQVETPQASKKAPQPSTPALDFDSKSLQAINEVRRRFNLSSDLEAARLLIALGYEKFNSFK